MSKTANDYYFEADKARMQGRALSIGLQKKIEESAREAVERERQRLIDSVLDELEFYFGNNPIRIK